MGSCSHWWHAPIYFTISVVLAFIAISTALKSPSSSSSPLIINHTLSHNASAALRRSGSFNIIATLLSISPEIFLSSPNSTIFAIQDSSLTNASSSPLFLKHLLQYHTAPFSFSMADLLRKPQGTCFRTLFRHKNVALTKVDPHRRYLEINHVLVSHPDMFLQGNIAIHGVLGSFSSMGSQDYGRVLDSIIQAPICDANSSLVLEDKDMIQWNRIVRLLSSNGFVSFAIGLNSVLDGILKDYSNLSSVTILSPPEILFVASPSAVLDKIVKLHILPQKVTYSELASMPYQSLLRTLLPNQPLQITGGFNVTEMQGLTINGVEIIAPEIFSSNRFIIHGISHAFNVAELPRRLGHPLAAVSDKA
ncbi:fasciclin-like arabinogalactan protein 21 [Mercurialis annua]|uniref:fasciclin-like arabinogalactan protein 21 n=1 Tax=Mercurialis annua TaxID=3986 RepID=UPI002160D41B|nr:fasciclin-like arabinogalactan protein 21 [Mercurialis annua]